MSMLPRASEVVPGFDFASRLMTLLRAEPLEYRPHRHSRMVEQIGRLSQQLETLSEDGLTRRIRELKARRGSREDRGFLVETFALVREVARRTVGLRPFDVQLEAGLAVLEERIVQMDTGEGKTLAIAAPVVAAALLGERVRVFTFNDYLARRDSEWMGPIYRAFGLRTSCVLDKMSRDERRSAYDAEICYCMARTSAFDYLRDGLASTLEEQVQTRADFLIVDEADSLLIDEARIPMVVAGEFEARIRPVALAASLVRDLVPERDFATDENDRNVFFTDHGLDLLEQAVGKGNLLDESNRGILTELNLALHARVLLTRDVDYVVREGGVELVDEFTGRVADRRRWPDGLQSALEAKEGLEPRREGVILGSITLQKYMNLHQRISGLTATARSAAEDFHQFYRLKTVLIPPNKPCIRQDLSDQVFSTREAKEQALVQEIGRVHRTGQPILVGTVSIRESERLAGLLKSHGIQCRVLNAKNDEEEAGIIAQAGTVGAVTISTNMAGRGTDIALGPTSASEHARVVELGGLYVLGTNRHESRRIDDQLRGRAGRQGDPGRSRFFISLEDDLMVRFGIDNFISRQGHSSGSAPLPDSLELTRGLARVQDIIETANLSTRITLRDYSARLEEQMDELRQFREKVLRLDEEAIGNLLGDYPGRAALLERLGPRGCLEVEARVILATLAMQWAEHLSTAADIREGINLMSHLGFNPLGFRQMPKDEFHKRLQLAYQEFGNRVTARCRELLQEMAHEPGHEEFLERNLEVPAATWVYVTSDNLLGDVMLRASANMKKKFARALGKRRA